MATYSTHNVRQVIVANSSTIAGGTPIAGAVTAIGSILSGAPERERQFYFSYMNGEGVLMRSDLIKEHNIQYLKGVTSRPATLRQDLITFNPDFIEAGQDYIIRILFREWGSGSAEDQYFKFAGAVTARNIPSDADKALMIDDLATRLAALGNSNFRREATPLLTYTKIGTGLGSAILVQEIEQPFVLDRKEGRPLNYDIQFVSSSINGIDTVEWATVNTVVGSDIGVGTNRLARNMESFYLRERGDVYKYNGYWENAFEPAYVVQAGAVYDMLEFQFFYKGRHIFTQNSDKELTIMCLNDGTHAVANAILAAIRAETGLTTTDLPDLADPTTPSLINAPEGVTLTGTTTSNLTANNTYYVFENPGTVDQVIYAVDADGTLNAIDPETNTPVSAPLTANTPLTLPNVAPYSIVQV